MIVPKKSSAECVLRPVFGSLFGLYRAPGNPGSRWAGKKSSRKLIIGTFGLILVDIACRHGKPWNLGGTCRKSIDNIKKIQGGCLKTQLNIDFLVFLGLPIIVGRVQKCI